MKARTISIIRNILEQKSEIARINFNNIESNLMDKYGAKYNVLVTPSEKKMYLDALNEMNSCFDSLDDFNEHNWN